MLEYKKGFLPQRSFTLSLLSGPHDLVDGKLFRLRRLVIKLKLEHTFILEKLTIKHSKIEMNAFNSIWRVFELGYGY